jgi:hypothetical protein
MAKRRTPDLSWLSVYPVQDEVEDWPAADKPLYVNVGAGIGQQCAEFRQKYPTESLPGRVILQDLPYAIAAALPTPGVENTVHNFFEPQPVKGAKFYFLRGVGSVFALPDSRFVSGMVTKPIHKLRKLPLCSQFLSGTFGNYGTIVEADDVVGAGSCKGHIVCCKTL